MALLKQYAELEGDLQSQAQLIRDDRIMIAGGVRQSDQALNLAVQVAERNHRETLAGGPGKWIVRFENPVVRIYGNAAVASFVRLTNIFPHGAAPISQSPVWVTLVLVKERSQWGIAHTHVSPAGNG
ncbi:MAG TPA: nuclear transport factor 2 family protein [Pseudomonadales bacterium]